MVEPSNETTETQDEPTELVPSAGERHSLFASDRRQLAFDILTRQTTSVDLDALAEEIAARESETFAISEETLERIRAILHHVHLPKLAEVGFLDYDPESHRIDPEGLPLEEGGRSSGPVIPETTASNLAVELRQTVQAYFDESAGETASLDDLARYTAAQLADTHGRSAKQLRIRLHHVTLPTLEDVGFIDYDVQTNTVRRRENSS